MQSLQLGLAYTWIICHLVSANACDDSYNARSDPTAARSPVRKSLKISTPLQSMPRSTIISATASKMLVMMVLAPFSHATCAVLFGYAATRYPQWAHR